MNAADLMLRELEAGRYDPDVWRPVVRDPQPSERVSARPRVPSHPDDDEGKCGHGPEHENGHDIRSESRVFRERGGNGGKGLVRGPADRRVPPEGKREPDGSRKRRDCGKEERVPAPRPSHELTLIHLACEGPCR
jgi:hypothetical protein